MRMIFKKFADIDDAIRIKIQELSKNSSELKPVNHEFEILDHNDIFCSGDDILHWILAFEESAVIGRAITYKRTVSFEGEEFILGGIGGVKVRDSHRRRGIAAKLIEIAMVDLQEADCSIVFLGTNIQNPVLVNFYEKFGFQLLGKDYVCTGRSGREYSFDDGMIASINDHQLYTKILNSPSQLNLRGGNW
jgi:predicted acetyltransferase